MIDDRLRDLIDNERYEEALMLLNSNNIEPTNPNYIYSYTIIYYRLKNFSKALTLIEWLIKDSKSPYYLVSKLLKGFIHKELHQWEEAHKSFLDFYLEFPQSVHRNEAGFLSCLCLEELKKFEEASFLYKKLYTDNPNSNIIDEVLFRWGYCLDRVEEWTLAREKYLEILTRFPESSKKREICFMVGMTYFRQNSFELAKKYFEEASQYDNETPSFLNEMASELLKISGERSVESKKVHSKYDPYS
ncbi:MAG: tetratricopeptide repeat protein [Candidatus Hydrogenedentota bacterium]